MRYKDFTVTVNSASRSPQGLLKTVALQEYPAKGPYQGNTAYTFIASQACQQFSITVQNDNPKDASVVFYVDGQMASVLLCYAKPKCHIVTCHGVQPQPGVLRRFVFKRATLTDEASASAPSQFDEVGVIRVVIRRCVVLSYDADATYMQFNSHSAVNERTQKGVLDTRTGLQLPEPYKGGPYANVIYMDSDIPWAEFVFTYKSIDLLQALGVAPSNPGSVSSMERGQKRSRPSQEDVLREENKRLRLELRRLHRASTEPLESEPSSSTFKTRKLVIKKEIDIVDLTED